MREKFTLQTKLSALFALVILVNGVVWLSVRDVKPVWANVPPVPSHFSATLPALGDGQFAYRLIALFLQNLGDTGGRTTSLKLYDYEELEKWFKLQHNLDPRSNATPSLAGYVFSGNQNVEELDHIVNYLELAGSVDEPQKWRWWVQAVFLARHRMKDYDRALEIADKLAKRDEAGMPAFTRQMSAFILNKQGEKDAALSLMINLLKSEGENLNPAEINAIKFYICEQILQAEEAQTHDLCREAR